MDSIDRKGSVGIDVSKKSLDLFAYATKEHWQIDRTEEEILKLSKKLKEMNLNMVIMEATGGLETIVVSILIQAGIPVVVVNPRQVRDFAKATGTFAKTDRIDAEILAHFAEAVKPEVRPLPDEFTQELSGLMARRRQLVDMLAAEKNRYSRAVPKIQREISQHIDWLNKRIKEIDKGLRDSIKLSPVWREKENVLRSVPGVGHVFSVTLLANVPELGHLNRKEIATLIGVAPLNRDSGTLRGKRTVWGGRAHVRSVLYMATLAAIRINPVIRRFYKRLIRAGKKAKVAITACMRKLITILNSMIKHNTRWQHRYSFAS